MFYPIEPFFCENLKIRIEAQIDSRSGIVECLYVYKVGDREEKGTDITDSLTKHERLTFEELVREDYENCESKNREPDGLAMSKTRKEWNQEDAS